MWVQHRRPLASNGLGGVISTDYYQDISFANRTLPGLAFGGVGLERRAGVIALSTGTSLSVTGLDFAGDGVPDLLLFSTGFAPIGNVPHFTEGARTSYGACGPDLSQWSVSLARGYNTGTDAYTMHTDDSVLSYGYPGIISVASLDVDGFTIEWDSSSWLDPSNAIGWLAMKFHGGLTCKVGTLTQPASTGVQTLSGWGFTPAAAMLAGVSLTGFSSAGWQLGARHNVGFAATDGGESAMNGGHRWGNRFETAVAYKDDRTIYLYEHDGATLGVRGDANVVMIPGGMELDWTVCDGVQRKLGFVAWEANEPVDTSQRPLAHIAAVGQSHLNSPGTFHSPTLPNTDGGIGLGWGISPSNSFMAASMYGSSSDVWHYARDRMIFAAPSFPTTVYRLYQEGSERALRRVLDIIRHNAPR